MQLQSDFAQTQMQEFMGQVQKMSKIYQDMGKASFAPVESAIAKSKDAMHG